MGTLSKRSMNKAHYILVLLLIFSSTNTVPAFRDIYIIFLVTIGLVIYFRLKGYVFGKYYFNFLLIFGLFTFVYFLQFSTFNPIFSIRVISVVTIAYIVAKMVKLQLIVYFEDIVYKLALISLPLFLWQILDFNSLYQLNGFIEKYLPFGEFGGVANTNSLVFTMKTYAPFRNSGFMWEPGAFAAMLSLPLYFNLSRNNFTWNRKLIVMVIALLTTQSTMGYLVFLLLGLYMSFNPSSKENKVIPYIFSLIVIAALAVFTVQQDFMAQKIQTEYSNIDATIDMAYSRKTASKDKMSLGRMASLIMDLQTVKKYPLVGIGGQSEVLEESVYDVNRTNGWGDFIRTFGVLGVIILLINLMRTGNSFQLLFNSKSGKIFFVLIFLTFTFSNGIIMLPLFITLQWFYLINKRTVKTINNLQISNSI
jgi:hypothetical protein